MSVIDMWGWNNMITDAFKEIIKKDDLVLLVSQIVLGVIGFIVLVGVAVVA